jgi:hypothetical protein
MNALRYSETSGNDYCHRILETSAAPHLLQCSNKYVAVPLHTVKVYWGRRSIAPLFITSALEGGFGTSGFTLRRVH